MKKGNSLKIFIALITISAFFIPQFVFATDFYVDFTSGVDSADCTNPTAPCQTFLAPGIGGVSAGDNLNCTGIYDGTTGTDIFVPGSGTPGNPITFQQWPGQTQPVIDMTANPGVWQAAGIGFFGSYITFDGFEVAANATSTNSIAVAAIGSTDLTISNNTIHGMTNFGSGSGIFATDTVNLTVENNILYDNDQNTLLGGANAYLNANRIYDTNGNSLSAFTIGNHYQPLITNNYIYDFTGGFGLFLGNPFAPPGSDPATDTLVLNNSFYNNSGAVYASTVAGSSHEFIDNIIYSDGNKYIGLSDSTNSTSYFSNLTSNYNDFYVGSTDYVARYQLSGFPPTIVTYGTVTDWQGSPFSQDANSFSSDPQFVDLTPGSVDLDLQGTSPCADAGTSTAPYVTTDIDGTARPQGSAYDVGAFEILSIPTPGTPTNVTASNITHNTADISWTAASLATHYDIEYSINSDMSGSSTKSVSSINTTLTGLENGTTYYVRVRGKYYSGGWITGAWSDKINFDTLIPAPTGFTLDYAKVKKAKFSWDLDETVVTTLPDNLYILEISTRSDFKNTIIYEDIENKYYTAKQLKSSKHYYARVKSVTAEEESSWSSVIDFRTIPRKTTLKRVDRIGNISANVVFKKIPRVKKMSAKVLKKTANGWIEKYSITYGKNKFKSGEMRIDNLTPGIKYKVRVRGTWETDSKGPYHGKWSIGKTFKL
ncbi:fibronectin type III domain-containing protein [Patescibacteria group bacterium]|nr:fibronectin type III domain-containing protein [Patescibacteria group bacterium]MBU1673640.1 fibronectin type III domain-containing protein [Patescibacteria group bacterium]MBU1963872.1 fibronectin type III domain-containing protein [Patescibacteria group bacterium]